MTGKEWDPEVQLYYFGARWYDPEIGRWLSREPYKLDGPNLYQYTFNDPINGYDEDGLDFVDLVDLLGIDQAKPLTPSTKPIYKDFFENKIQYQDDSVLE